MKKISRSDLQGLRCQFPVLTKEEMRRHVGGYSDSYWNGDWSSSDPYFADFGANSGSSYGYGGSGDIDGGYLPEVVINGGSGYSGGYTYSGGNGYPGWGDGEDWGTGYGSYGYGTGYESSNGVRTDCVAQSIALVLNIPVAGVTAWIESHYGKNGVLEGDYYKVLNHFFTGSPTPIPPYKYERFGENSGPTLLATIIRPDTNDGHSVFVTKIDGTRVEYLDPQNGTGGVCTTLDIKYLYRVDGHK